ncbi:TolC family protein [Colwelliaceae bacterium MEBiC 14330]
MKKQLFSCSLSLVLICSLSTVMAQSFSFEQAWQRVLKESDALAAEQQNIERSMHLKDAASDLNLPSISLNANYTRLDHSVKVKPSDLIESMPIDSVNQAFGIQTDSLDSLFTSTLTERDIFTSSIRALWPIYTGGRISAAQNIADAQTQEASFLLTIKQSEKFEQLVKYYFALVLSEKVLKTRKEVERGLRQHYHNALKLEQQGQINKVERLQAQVSLNKAQVELKKSYRDAEIAQVALSRLLKVSAQVEPTSTLFVNENLPKMPLFIDKTLSQFPALKLLDSKKTQAKGLIELEQGKYYPEVYLYGNYNLYEEDDLASKIAPDWEIGIGLRVPILDSSGRAGKTKAAHSTVMQVSHLQAQAIQDLSVLVEKTYREASQSLEEFTGLESSLTLSNENLKLRTKAFSQGMATSLDVVDAQLYVASIESQRFVAAYQYLLSLAKLLTLSSDINSFKYYQSSQGIEVK